MYAALCVSSPWCTVVHVIVFLSKITLQTFDRELNAPPPRRTLTPVPPPPAPPHPARNGWGCPATLSLLAVMNEEGRDVGVTYWESPERKCLNECRLPLPEILPEVLNHDDSGGAAAHVQTGMDTRGRVSSSGLAIVRSFAASLKNRI